MKDKKILTISFVLISILFSPFLISPDLLTLKDNDLGRTYIPLFSFFKDSVLTYNQVPLWRGDQLFGETFVGNPLSSLFYPLNILFLLFPVGLASVLYYLSHFFLAFTSTFYLAKSFKLSQTSSIAAGVFYALSIKMLSHVEAGHITMIAAFSLFPLTIFTLKKCLTKDEFKWQSATAITLALTYFAYPTIFFYSLGSVILFWLYETFETRNVKKVKESVFPILVILLLTLGLIAIVLLPHLELGPLSTRSSMTLQDVALPIWNIKRLALSIAFPYAVGDLTHEQILYFGLIPSVLSVLGFCLLNLKNKIVLFIVFSGLLLFVAGISTPVFPFLYDNFPFIKYLRITTRIWFIPTLIVSLLSGYYLEKIKNKKIILILLPIFLIESSYIFMSRNSKIPKLNTNEKIYQLIKSDPDIFRVYCTTYCFNPQLLQKYKINLLNGETPIQQKETVSYLSKAGNYNYQNFAVIFPPYQVWQVQTPPTPDANLLGQANVKYVASTFKIENSNYSLVQKLDEIYLYKNNKFTKRAFFENSSQFAKIDKVTPNGINIKFNSANYPRPLIYSEIYYPGWIATVINQKFNVAKSENSSLKVVVPQNSEDIWLKYQPKSFILGRTITFSTLTVILLILIKKRIKKI